MRRAAAIAALWAAASAPEEEAMAGEAKLRLAREAQVVVASGLNVDSRALAATAAGRLYALVRARAGGSTLIALDAHAQRAQPDAPVALDTATALLACGDRLAAAGTAAGGWRVVLLDGGGRVERTLAVPSRARPLCVGGALVLLYWEGERLAIAPAREPLEPRRVDLGGPTLAWDAAAARDAVILARGGAAGRAVELVEIADGKVRARAAIPGTEGARAPFVAAAGGELWAGWAQPGAPERLMVQRFDAALAPLGPPREVAALAPPHAFAFAAAEPGPDGVMIVSWLDRAPLPGRPSAHARSTSAAAVSATAAGPAALLDPDGEVAARWLADRLVVLSSPPGALAASLWSLAP